MNRIVSAAVFLMLMCLAMPVFAEASSGGYFVSIIEEGHSIASMELPPHSQIKVQADHMENRTRYNGNVRLEFWVGKDRGFLKANALKITPVSPPSGDSVQE